MKQNNMLAMILAVAADSIKIAMSLLICKLRKNDLGWRTWQQTMNLQTKSQTRSFIRRKIPHC